MIHEATNTSLDSDLSGKGKIKIQVVKLNTNNQTSIKP